MSYQVLARKWRPHQFKDVVGQSHVLTALSNALDQDRLHHAYLFSGTRGVGKTTIARIFAKALNCEAGMSASPCGVCSTCQEIDQGRYVDLLEIDAASRTKVEDTRDLLDNVQYKPARGRFKVYLIDEVHMLSRNSFNALLKTLEEPPEYVKFLLATTDPQKLPVTILSRCLQFHLKHLDAEQIKNQLNHVLTQESLPAEMRALSLIARAAEGSMRDALSLTDQAIALGSGAVIESQVIEMLGTLSTDQAILLLESLAKGQADPVMKCVTALAEVGIEWDGLLKELAAQIHRIAMGQALPEAIDKNAPDAERILHLTRAFSPQDIQLFYQIVLQGRQDIAYAPDGRAGLEMVLLRMLAFRPVTAGGYEPKRIQIPSVEPSNANISGASNPSLSQAQALNPSQNVQMASSALSRPEQKIQDMRAQLLGRNASEHHAQVKPSNITTPEQVSNTVNAGAMIPQGEPPAYLQVPTMAYDDMPPPRDEAYEHLVDMHIPLDDRQMPPQNELISSHNRDVTPQNHETSVQNGQVSSQDQFESPQTTQVQTNMPSPIQPASGAASQGGHMALLRARNALRSQKKALQEKGLQEHQSAKKTDAVSQPPKRTNAIERLAQKHQPMPRTQVENTNVKPTEPLIDDYRWQPSQPKLESSETILSPEQIKKALMHDRTPEMKATLVRESSAQDPWCRISSELNTSQLTKLVAINASMQQDGHQIKLTLRSHQQHLMNADMNKELTQALVQYFGDSIYLIIELGDQGITPIEWRDKLYEEKLIQANQSLINDPNVIFFCQRFNAQIDEDSVRPL